MGLDIIGDIHGQGDRLEGLLAHMGYSRRAGAWRHPSRTAIFVGDLIDRGPGQLQTLTLVRDMMEAGTARAVMGNHELNAIAWATPHAEAPDRYLRPRDGDKGEKNRRQHQAFLDAVGEDGEDHRSWADWFMGLPLWIEEPEFRVVHACWSPRHVETLRPLLATGERLTPDLLAAAHCKGDPAHEAVEVLLKGVEVTLPGGAAFTDKDGHARHEIRTRWWDPSLTTYRAAYIGPDGVTIPDIPITAHQGIAEVDRPTFIGHYWFDPKGPIQPAARRVACVDYSAAKGGPLTAYRFNGEDELSAEGFVWV